MNKIINKIIKIKKDLCFTIFRDILENYSIFRNNWLSFELKLALELVIRMCIEFAQYIKNTMKVSNNSCKRDTDEYNTM